MENNTLAYFGLGVILLLLFGTFAMSSMRGKAVSNIKGLGNNDISDHHKGTAQTFTSSNKDLSKYRSEDIPEDCRLADYDNDVKKWAEHLSHHENTRYCLEYFKDV